jgi:hypothetical protein
MNRSVEALRVISVLSSDRYQSAGGSVIVLIAVGLVTTSSIRTLLDECPESIRDLAVSVSGGVTGR